MVESVDPTFRRRPLQAAGLLVFALLVWGTLSLWNRMTRYERDAVNRVTRAELERFAREVEFVIEMKANALLRMAARTDDVSSPQEWARDARLYIEHHRCMTMLVWVDASGTARWSEWATDAPPPWDTDDPAMRSTVAQARASAGVVFSPPITLHDGRPVFLACAAAPQRDAAASDDAVPDDASSDDAAPGYIVAVCEYKPLFDALLPATLAGEDTLTIFDGGEQVYDSGDPGDGETRAIENTSETTLNAHGRTWRVAARPGAMHNAGLITSLPETVLIAGLLLAAMIGLLGQLVIHLRRRRRELEAANERLRQIDQIQREHDVMQSTLTAMEKILGIVAHELRTPLAALRATSEYLLTMNGESNGDHDESNTLTRIIHDETVRMAELVNNLLEAARLNSGCITWHWSTVRLAEACDHAFNVVRPLVDHTQVVLDYSIEPLDLEMRGDAEAIRRLIINFVSNSAKHTETGSIRVDIRATQKAGGPWVVIDVSDTGTGISEKVAHKLGQAFVLNSGVVGSDYVKGAGLGLSICRGIVEAHGGKIHLQSREGEGSLFRIEMPANLEGPVEMATGGKITLEKAA